jgi:hypothetical protein
MDLIPFFTLPIIDPDFNSQDQLSEFDKLFSRQIAIQSCVDGDLSAEDLLDLLEDQGVDPNLYVDSVIDNVEFVIGN